MSRPTLESVARQAAVSRQTVSNVLNAPHLVRADTLDRVRAVIASTGYRPHRAARTLRTRRSQLVGARLEPIADGVHGVVLQRFLHSLTALAQPDGYRVMLFTAEGDADETAVYSELLGDHDLDAFVLTGTHAGDTRTAWLAERSIPFLTFGRPWGETEVRHGWVDVDGAAGTAQASRHLLDRGHRRIAFLGWPAGSGAGDDRRAGWAATCADAGLLDERLSAGVLDGLTEGRRASAALLDLADPPTAILCASDSLALGAWTEVTGRGLRPGHDVAVIGFDDSPTAAIVGLSSIAQPLEDVAAACLQMLRSVLATDGPPPAPPEPVLLPSFLVSRSSG